jgi:hypothetical protein
LVKGTIESGPETFELRAFSFSQKLKRKGWTPSNRPAPSEGSPKAQPHFLGIAQRSLWREVNTTSAQLQVHLLHPVDFESVQKILSRI